MNLTDLFERNVTAELTIDELWSIMQTLTKLNLIGDMLKKDGDNRLGRMGAELIEVHKELVEIFSKFDTISDEEKNVK